jgi:hypothetical protein
MSRLRGSARLKSALNVNPARVLFEAKPVTLPKLRLTNELCISVAELVKKMSPPLPAWLFMKTSKPEDIEIETLTQVLLQASVNVTVPMLVPFSPAMLLLVRSKETEDAQADGAKTAKISSRYSEYIFRRSGILFTTLPTPFGHGLRVVRCQRHPSLR